MGKELRMPPTNHVTISGTLVRDASLRYTQSNKAIAGMGIANNRKYRNAQGEQAQDTTFVDVDVFGPAADMVGTFKKGDPVMVEGTLVTDEWEDKQSGQKRSKNKIKAFTVSKLSWDEEYKPKPKPQPVEQEWSEAEPDDDIPF